MSIIPLDYFIGGVHAKGIYDMNRSDLHDLLSVTTLPSLPIPSAETMKLELSLIGLVAFFESFCKNHFASAINIFPELLSDQKFVDNLHIGLNDLINVNYHLDGKIGSIISEKIDFGDAKKINFYYHSLFNFTPFSKKDISKYNELLLDRNLLTHHSGVITNDYRRARIKRRKLSGRLFLDSLTVSKNEILKWDDFLYRIVTKISVQSGKSLLNFIETNNIKPNKERVMALKFFLH